MRVGELLKKVAKLLYRPERPADLTQAVYHELKHLPRGSRYWRVLYGSTLGPLAALAGSLRRHYRVVVNERIVEIPFVFRHLDLPPGAAVLEFGSVKSWVSLALASLGYRVTGVDLRPYRYSHPNVRFLQGDFRAAQLPAASFDGVVAVSAIEHCGLSGYGEEGFERGDHEVVAEIRRVLKPGGRFLVTVPFGKAGVSRRGWRVYDAAALALLLRDFEVRTASYFKGTDRSHWTAASAGELADLDSAAAGFVQGVACVSAVKPAQAGETR